MEPEITNESEREVANKAIEFPLGIPGFAHLKHFVFVQRPEEQPFAWMRSLEDENLGFAVVEAYHLVPDFSFEVDDRELEEIGSPPPERCAVFFIVKIEVGEPVKVIANCRSPLLINVIDRVGRQVVLHSETVEPTTFEF